MKTNYMIEFDEPHKFKWNIIYQCVKNNEENAEIVALGKFYDFIPEKGSLIIIDEVVYAIANKIFDFDRSNIVISLSELKKDA